MANPEHLEVLKSGVDEWNQWREAHSNNSTTEFRLLSQLTAASIIGAKLYGAKRNRTSVKVQSHRLPTSRRPTSSASTSRITLARCRSWR
jgi:hypothetical protein